MPRAVVYGPGSIGGMAWDDCGIILLYEKLKMLIGSIRMQDTVGKLIILQLTWLQIFAGSSVPILQLKSEIPYLPIGWLNTVHHHLVRYGVQVEVWGVWVPKSQRANDRVLMDIAQHKVPSWGWGGLTGVDCTYMQLQRQISLQ